MADMMDLDGGWDENMFDDVLGDNPDIMKLVVFLIDSSGSMEGTVIGTINSVMEEVLSEMEKDKSHKCISIVRFGEGVQWNAAKPQTIEEVGGWSRIQASNLSNMGEAFKQLGEKLEQKDWCPSGQKGIKGVFVLFSDGMATDHYEDGMAVLKKSGIFQKGKKLAVNFSERYDRDVLLDFAEKDENILNAKSSEIGKAEKKVISVINE